MGRLCSLVLSGKSGMDLIVWTGRSRLVSPAFQQIFDLTEKRGIDKYLYYSRTFVWSVLQIITVFLFFLFCSWNEPPAIEFFFILEEMRTAACSITRRRSERSRSITRSLCVLICCFSQHHRMEGCILRIRRRKFEAEKRDRNAERERKRRFGVNAIISQTPKRLFLSLSLHFCLSSPPSHFFLALTFGQYILFENACKLQRVVLHLEEKHRSNTSFW